MTKPVQRNKKETVAAQSRTLFSVQNCLLLVFVIAGGLALYLATELDNDAIVSQPASNETSPADSAEPARQPNVQYAYAKKVAQANALFNAQLKTLKAECWKTIYALKDSEFKEALRQVKPTITALTSKTTSGKLIYYSAIDKIKGGERAVRIVHAIMEPMDRPLQKAKAEIEAALNRLTEGIRKADNQRRKTIIEIDDEFVQKHHMDKKVFEEVERKVTAVKGQTPKVVLMHVSVGVGIGLELFFIKPVSASMTKVFRKFIGPIIDKVAKRIGATLPAAALDGPLPFGDIVCAAVSLYSFGAVVELVTEIQNEREYMTKRLTLEIARTRRKTIDETKKLLKGLAQIGADPSIILAVKK